MSYGTRIRDLRRAKGLARRNVAKAGQGHGDLPEPKRHPKLTFGEFPSNYATGRPVCSFEAVPDELSLLIEDIPATIRPRVL